MGFLMHNESDFYKKSNKFIQSLKKFVFKLVKKFYSKIFLSIALSKWGLNTTTL